MQIEKILSDIFLIFESFLMKTIHIRHGIISNMKLSDLIRILNYLLIIKLILFQCDVFLFGHGYHAPLEFSDFDQRFLELQISSSGQ